MPAFAKKESLLLSGKAILSKAILLKTILSKTILSKHKAFLNF